MRVQVISVVPDSVVFVRGLLQSDNNMGQNVRYQSFAEVYASRGTLSAKS